MRLEAEYALSQGKTGTGVEAVVRYYKLQPSTEDIPSVPAENPPTDWSTTEPAYTEESTDRLYYVDCTIFDDGTYSYSDVSMSSSYDAARLAKETADGIKENIYVKDTENINGMKLAEKSVTVGKLDVKDLAALKAKIGKWKIDNDGLIGVDTGSFSGFVLSSEVKETDEILDLVITAEWNGESNDITNEFSIILMDDGYTIGFESNDTTSTFEELLISRGYDVGSNTISQINVSYSSGDMEKAMILNRTYGSYFGFLVESLTDVEIIKQSIKLNPDEVKVDGIVKCKGLELISDKAKRAGLKSVQDGGFELRSYGFINGEESQGYVLSDAQWLILNHSRIIKALQSMMIGSGKELYLSDGSGREFGVRQSKWYSQTKEIFTGEYWRNGCPIYRKVVTSGAIASAKKTIAHNISGVRNIWIDLSHSFLEATVNGVTYNYPVIRQNTAAPTSTSSTTSHIRPYVNKTDLIIEAGTNANFSQGYFALLYTKSTDEELDFDSALEEM